jgi:arrestin-1
LANPDDRDAFGIIVSYSVKVKLYLGALGGELTGELPIILMHPKPEKGKMIREDSQAGVETFRQDTIDYDGPICKGSEDPVYDDFSRMKIQQ